jgi:hypothetical protein
MDQSNQNEKKRTKDVDDDDDDDDQQDVNKRSKTTTSLVSEHLLTEYNLSLEDDDEDEINELDETNSSSLFENRLNDSITVLKYVVLRNNNLSKEELRNVKKKFRDEIKAGKKELNGMKLLLQAKDSLIAEMEQMFQNEITKLQHENKMLKDQKCIMLDTLFA